jgi:CheY-like chemotaxis protein
VTIQPQKGGLERRVTDRDLVRAFARRVIDRWKAQGFDTIGTYPSGYSYPINSRVVPEIPQPGYEYFPIDSVEAIDAVTRAIDAGASYSFREVGSTDAGDESLKGVRVLVVDDRSDTLEMLTVALETCGAEVSTAGSAEDALDSLLREKPDIIVSDIRMPNVNGYSLIRKIRSLDEDHGGRIPAVALSALGSKEDVEFALEAGFQAHVSKPVEPEHLVSVMSRMLPAA